MCGNVESIHKYSNRTGYKCPATATIGARFQDFNEQGLKANVARKLKAQSKPQGYRFEVRDPFIFG